MKRMLLFASILVWSIPGCRKAPAANPVSFGIFEIVDCAITHTAPKPVQDRSGEKFCLASMPIVTEHDIRAAEAGSDRFSKPQLSIYFARASGDRLQQASQRIFAEYQSRRDRGRLAVVVDGKVIMAPVITGPMSDSIVINGNFTEKEIEQLAASLNASRD